MIEHYLNVWQAGPESFTTITDEPFTSEKDAFEAACEEWTDYVYFQTIRFSIKRGISTIIDFTDAIAQVRQDGRDDAAHNETLRHPGA